LATSIRDGGATGPGETTAWGGGVLPSSDLTSCSVKGIAVRSSAMFFREFPDGASALSAVCIQTALTRSESGASFDGEPNTENARGDLPQGVEGPGKDEETLLSGVGGVNVVVASKVLDWSF
jgi:hypothetical protein